jgi:hypothetical protein
MRDIEAKAETPGCCRAAKMKGKAKPDYAASSAGFGRVQIRNTGVFAKG